MRDVKAVGVFCGSNTGAGTRFIEAAAELGGALARAKICMVYGGANNGLMGALAAAARRNHGQVYGVITKKLLEIGHLFNDLTGHEVVETTALRKARMVELADAFIALPGGVGTTEEFMAVWSENQLGYIDKPVGLLNVDGYFDAFLAYVDRMVTSQFLPASHGRSLVVEREAEGLLKSLASFEKPTEAKWL